MLIGFVISKKVSIFARKRINMMETKITDDYLVSCALAKHLKIWHEFTEGNIRTGGTPRGEDGCYSMLTKLEGTRRHKDVYIVDYLHGSDTPFIKALDGYVNTILMDKSLITQFHLDSCRRGLYNVYIVSYVYGRD